MKKDLKITENYFSKRKLINKKRKQIMFQKIYSAKAFKTIQNFLNVFISHQFIFKEF